MKILQLNTNKCKKFTVIGLDRNNVIRIFRQVKIGKYENDKLVATYKNKENYKI